MIRFKIIPTYFQILLSGLHLETISGVPVLGIAKLPWIRWLTVSSSASWISWEPLLA